MNRICGISFPEGIIGFRSRQTDVYKRQGKIKLPKLKAVKARLHREYSGQIKSVTVSQVSSGKYYGSILVETEMCIRDSTYTA